MKEIIGWRAKEKWNDKICKMALIQHVLDHNIMVNLFTNMIIKNFLYL